MTKNRANREDRNGNGNGGMDFTISSRAKRDRESGSQGSPTTNKKPNKPANLNMSKGGGEETPNGGGLRTEAEDAPNPRDSPPSTVGVAASRDGSLTDKEPSQTYTDNRKNLIESQLKNRYNPKSLPPFIVLVECNKDSNPEGSSFGNLHPMAIARSICVKCGDSNMMEIRSVGKMLQEITFGSADAANGFVEKRDRLPKEWSIYIPNFKVRRMCVVRGVDPSLSDQSVMEGISWLGDHIKIIDMERLKFKDRGSKEIRNSSSIKITMESDLLPEYMLIWKRRIKVFPYINRVRKCVICARWGHSAPFCRGVITCGRCGDNHSTSSCFSVTVKCANCGGDHESFNPTCRVFLRHKIINAVMAFTNTSRVASTRLIKARNIFSLEQVENNFRSMAYKSWNVRDLELIPSDRRSKMRSRGNEYKEYRKRDIGSGLSLPVVSSSRYLSCIESPVLTNTPSVVSPQELNPQITTGNNKSEERNKGPTLFGGTPGEDKASASGSIQRLTGSKEDLLYGQESNDYLSEIYYIMQQRNKTWRDRVSEVIAMSSNMVRTADQGQ